MVCRTLPSGELDDDTVALTLGWLWVALMVGSMVCLSSCRTPDAVRLGVGHRDETFGAAEYGGQMVWIEGEWRFWPTMVTLDDEAKLFLAEQRTHSGGSQAVPGVTVNVPHAGAEPGEAGNHTNELEAVGGWPWYVWIGLPFALIALAVPLWVWTRRKPATGSETAS